MEAKSFVEDDGDPLEASGSRGRSGPLPNGSAAMPWASRVGETSGAGGTVLPVKIVPEASGRTGCETLKGSGSVQRWRVAVS